MVEKVFKKYYSRMAKEGMLNAFILAFADGCVALFGASLVFWLTDFKYPWIGFIIMAIVTAGFTPLLYYTKFRPSKKMIAKRVDALGLEERLLTMAQLEGDDSFIAKRQREDAHAAIENVSSKLVKIVVSIPLIVLASISMVLGGGMSTVSILSSLGVIESGKDIIVDVVTPDPVTYEVEFVEMGEGVIDGEIFQIIEEGGTIEEVIAIPEDEWYLVGWTWEIDGVEYELTETDVFFVEGLTVNQNITITAVFSELSESDGQGDGEGEEGESDEQEPQESESEEGKDSEGDQEGEQDNPPSDQPGGDQAGGKSDPHHTVFDGETDYGGEVYDNAVEDAMNDVQGNDDIPDDWKDIIGDYFDNIGKD